MKRGVFPQRDPAELADTVRHYFGGIASRYDSTGASPYWSVSEAVLWELMERQAFGRFHPSAELHVLDAGAGTGTASLRVLRRFDRSRVTLLDLTEQMLDVARLKLADAGVADRARIEVADLQAATVDQFGRFNLVLCFHNVLSLMVDPADVMRRLLAVTRPGGLVAVVVPNLYHAVHFTLRQGRWDELQRIRERGAVRYTPDAPEMILFAPGQLREILGLYGADDIKVMGFPVSLYPMPEWTREEQRDHPAFGLLADEQRRSQFLTDEVNRCLNEELAARGNELLVVARAR